MINHLTDYEPTDAELDRIFATMPGTSSAKRTPPPDRMSNVKSSIYIFDAAEAVRVRPPKEDLFGACSPGIISMIVGDGSVGKSYLMLQLMVTLALHDRPQLAAWATAFGVKRPRTSSFVSLEDNADELHLRMQAIYKHLKLTPADATTIAGRCSFPVLEGSGFTVCDPAWTAATVTALKGRHPDGLDLLIIDTLSAAHTASESDNSSMNEVMQSIAQMREALGCTILLVHHVSKDAVRKPSTVPNASASRGASAVANRARMVMMLRPRDVDADDGVIELTVPKLNGGKRPKPQLWKAVEGGDGVLDPIVTAPNIVGKVTSKTPQPAKTKPNRQKTTTTKEVQHAKK